jgi:hypothetical protein
VVVTRRDLAALFEGVDRALLRRAREILREHAQRPKEASEGTEKCRA